MNVTSNGGANGATGEFLKLCADDESDPIAQVVNRSAHDLLLSFLPLDDAKVQQWQRSLSMRNTACLVEWHRRYRYGITYADFMGELERAEWSARHDVKVRLAKHLRDVIVHRAVKKAMAKEGNVVSIFHKRQAGEH